MALLIDTNILILAACAPDRISKECQTIILRSDRVYFSIINLVEIGIKASTGKLGLPFQPIDFQDFAINQGWILQHISPESTTMLAKLPLIHRDPFDRLLVAEAMVQRLALVTTDRVLKHYDIEVIEA